MLILRRETRAPLTTKTVLHFVRRPSPVVGSDRPSLLVTPSTSTTRCCEYRIVLIGGSRRRLLSLPSVVVVAVGCCRCRCHCWRCQSMSSDQYRHGTASLHELITIAARLHLHLPPTLASKCRQSINFISTTRRDAT